MDYQALHQVLPKPPQTWSNSDVLTWLEFINLPKYGELFYDKQIDGSCLGSLDEEDIVVELGIKSRICVKKLLNWIHEGLRQYEQYLLSQPPKSEPMQEQAQRFYTEVMRSLPNPKHNTQPKQTCEQMMISYYEGNQSKCYKVGHEDCVIGSDGTCDILVLEETVTHQHAHIMKTQNTYQIRDLGSKHGTFVKVAQKEPMVEGMLVEMGSFQFRVLSTNHLHKQLVLEAEHTMSQEFGKANLCFSFMQKHTYCFGRKNTNDFYHEDQHMSGIHAKIYYLGQHFYLEDMESTNGYTYIQPQNLDSIQSSLSAKHETVFKIGSVSTYICKFNHNSNKKSHDSSCLYCDKKRDVFFLPCRHSLTCFDCCERVQQCPVCSCVIQDKIKIYI